MTVLEAGELVGPYQVLEQIGKGGMAVVYKAYHAAMDRHVALKILPFQFAKNEAFLHRFRLEVRTIARLEHPRILPVYDSGQYKEIPYLIMRFLDTGTLKERLAEGRLALETVDQLFTQLADALAYAHSQQVIHRDVKPANVLINERSDVFLTDFGIAKLLGETSEFTATGAITGTPDYMSPEQAQGTELDVRSDIYSLGIVLYEMVTGRVPFEADTPLAVILKHVQQPLPPPSQADPGVHPEVEKVLLKALQKERDQRFQTVPEFVARWRQAYALARSAAEGSPETLDLPASVQAANPESSTSQPVLQEVEPPQPAEMQPPALPLPQGQPGAPAKTGPSRLLWAAAALIIIIGLIFGLRALFRQNQGAASRPGDAAETAGAGSLPAAAGEWRTYTGSNHVNTVAYLDGKVYAGGKGGITVWNTAGMSTGRFTYREGLPGNEIFTLHLDEEGRLWAGGSEGFARLDSDGSWTRFGRSEGLLADYVTAFAQWEDGMIVGTYFSDDPGGGIGIFDGSIWSPLPGFPSGGLQPIEFSNNINDLVKDPSGSGLWVATDSGLGFFDGGGWQRYGRAEGLPDDKVNALLVDQDGWLVVGTGAGAVFFDGASFSRIDDIEAYAVYEIVQALDGLIWFAAEHGVWGYDKAARQGQYFGQANGSLNAYSLSSAAVGEQGVLYFGGFDMGLFRYDGSFSQHLVPNAPRIAGSSGILAAPGGKLWFVEENGITVDIYDPETETWSLAPEASCCPVPLAFDSQGSLWAGGDTGLWIIEMQGETNLTTRHGLPSDDVFSVAFSQDGRAWVGTSAGIAVIENFAVVETMDGMALGVQDSFIVDLFAASDGSVWIATISEVIRAAPGAENQVFSIGAPFGDSFYRAQDFAEDADGHIWIATSGDGVYRFTGSEFTRYLPTDPRVALPSLEVNTVYAGPHGRIWFGTGQGAAVFDGEDWTIYGMADGLVHPNVNAIFAGLDGTVWFATSGGIASLGE